MPQGEKVVQQVFINCPFDDEYKTLLRPLLFTIIYLGFTPRIASEFLNSAANRIDKICELIKNSTISIHDLSRCISSGADEFFRMNMPFEFGIDYGYYIFNNPQKRMLVLEKNRYDYQKALSDLSGVDTKCHKNEPDEVVRCIRDWMIEANIIQVADSSTVIWYRFNDFTSDFYDKRKAAGFSNKDLNDMPTREYINAISKWVSQNNRKQRSN
jgi:hypothetical protein